MLKKGLLLLLIAGLALALAQLVDPRYLSIAGLKGELAGLEASWQASPFLFAAVFLLAYVVVSGLSLPFAVPLTLLGGAIFGLFWGLVIVSFGSSLGALASFLASRYLLRDWVQSRFGQRLQGLNNGIAKDGSFYLFTLRLIPVFPFFLINILMGLTPIAAWRFYVVSQLGMLAGTLVYVNAGTQLATIESLSGIVSPSILASFALLGLFPWLARIVVSVLQRRKIYRGYTRPRHFDRNLIVIGAGAAGLVSSYIASAVKAKVTLVESGKMGGDCLNYGCVPSKALIRSAKLAHEIRHAGTYGLEDATPVVSYKTVFARIAAIIRTIEPHDSVERYQSLGVDVVEGYARIIDPWTVEITLPDGATRRLTSRAIILATGASPIIPDIAGLDRSGFVTSDTLWNKFAALDHIPERIAVLGGGPIGSELAQALARLGSKVTQIERGARLLPREDHDISEFARSRLEADGVQVLTGHSARQVEVDADGTKILVAEGPDGDVRMAFDELVVAVGRKPRLTGFGLEELGIETGSKLVTNEKLQTIFPNILAAGDVAGPYQFTHVASHQAWYATVNALFGLFRSFKVDYRVVPWTTFIDPEVARLGLNEQDAKAGGIAHEVTRFEFSRLDRAIADSATDGFIKVLTPPGKDRILGVAIVGPHAGDMLAEFVLAMKHGLGLNAILSTIHAYPTLSEGSKGIAGVWRRNHVSPRLLSLLQWFHAVRR